MHRVISRIYFQHGFPKLDCAAITRVCCVALAWCPVVSVTEISPNSVFLWAEYSSLLEGANRIIEFALAKKRITQVCIGAITRPEGNRVMQRCNGLVIFSQVNLATT